MQLGAETLEARVVPAGTWTALAAPLGTTPGGTAVDGANTMMLLSDGTVMVQGGSGNVSNAWYRLSPDSHGHYVQGAWTQLGSMKEQRLYFPANVLQNGSVLVVGGENPTFDNTAEIYNPAINQWNYVDSVNVPQTSINGLPYAQNFGDDPTEVLPDGRVLAGFFGGPQTFIFDPSQPSGQQWSPGPNKLTRFAPNGTPFYDNSDEETWVKLPDGSILTYDNSTSNNLTIATGKTQFYAERYIPANTAASRTLGVSNVWWNASKLDPTNPPGPLSQGAGASEIGDAVLLPDGRVFFLGNNGGNTAFYNPVTNLWSAGPTVQNSRGFGDVPAVMMPNGHVLFTSYDGPANTTVLGFHLLEFDPTVNANVTYPYTDVSPGLSNFTIPPVLYPHMLMLPDGNVLVSMCPLGNLCHFLPTKR